MRVRCRLQSHCFDNFSACQLWRQNLLSPLLPTELLRFLQRSSKLVSEFQHLDGHFVQLFKHVIALPILYLMDILRVIWIRCLLDNQTLCWNELRPNFFVGYDNFVVAVFVVAPITRTFSLKFSRLWPLAVWIFSCSSSTLIWSEEADWSSLETNMCFLKKGSFHTKACACASANIRFYK